ncbi:MAG: zinc ribbon domain-containing protein [Gammaproteobacteria bacterium]|nr:zinc ribbon domain-containing protein [Gammaproteobacteria bacterium]
MPIYEYRCEACGHTLDALQKISDDPLSDCPSCEEPELKRLISAPAFRLKGGGWYETDFKSDKERKRNLAESGGGDGTAEKSDKSEKSDKTDKADKPSKTEAASTSSSTESKPKVEKSSDKKRPGNEAA